MSISLATKGIICVGGNVNIAIPPPLLSLSKAPHEAVLDLLQDNYIFYFDEVEIVQLWKVGYRMPNDGIPSIYAQLGTNEIEQRTIPEFKTTLETNNVIISYYTTSSDSLWNVQQVIKQIVVSNNKVQNTSQIKNTGIRWMKLNGFNYDFIFASEETVIYNLIASIDVVYQESYL